MASRLISLAALVLLAAKAHAAGSIPMVIETTAKAVIVRTAEGKEATRYLREKPEGSPSKSGSAAYFHPFTTPKGLVVTDVGPDDHPHHRGVFFAWVNMQGAVPSDFWGWGALAPIEDRRILNRDVKPGPPGAFTAHNEWIARETVLMSEQLNARASQRNGLNVLDLDFQLTPRTNTTLPIGAFSGFCVRTRKSPGIVAHEPAGVARHPAPKHDKPATGWPDRPWYAYSLDLPEGRGGVAVLNHPGNPPSLWHNLAPIGMLNPCIHAAAPLELKPDQPLKLRYRVVSFDGDVPTAKLDEMAREWAN